MNSYLIVGLGNPGPNYAFTRHNIGFLALDILARSYGAGDWGTEHKAWVLKFKTDHGSVILAKPQTFMNRSGESVQPLLAYYKIPIENMLVLHDELDIGFGQLRFHKNRGAGGHNGIKSITEQLGTMDYARLKLGIGRPPKPGPDVADWVLSKFPKEDESALSDFLNKAGDAVESWMSDGLSVASTKFNG